ncbi:MAG: hypothetical protein AB1713_06285 [Pseudomonadota bacterium]
MRHDAEPGLARGELQLLLIHPYIALSKPVSMLHRPAPLMDALSHASQRAGGNLLAPT